MVEKDFSCIKEVTKTVYIPLPSAYVSDGISGVAVVLESWKQQYVNQLQGIVVSFKNVSLISSSGFIVIDKPFVHYNVKATFELFCPSIGSILKGKINRISREHIGCLVHNINVRIDRPSRQSGDISQFIALDCIILFQITCIKYDRKAIRIKGSITDECVSLMKELPYFCTQNNVVESSISTCISTSDLSEATTGTEWQNGSSESDNDSTSLLQSEYSHLTKSNVLIKNDNENLNIVNNAHNAKSELPNFLASCVDESTSSSKISTSLSSQFSTSHKKTKKLKKRRSDNVSKNKHENSIAVNNQITTLSSDLDPLFQNKTKKHKHKKLNEKIEGTSLTEFEIHKKSGKKNKMGSKNDLSSSSVFDNSEPDEKLYDKSAHSVTSKKATKKLYNEYSCGNFNELLNEPLTSVTKSPEKTANAVATNNTNILPQSFIISKDTTNVKEEVLDLLKEEKKKSSDTTAYDAKSSNKKKKRKDESLDVDVNIEKNPNKKSKKRKAALSDDNDLSKKKKKTQDISSIHYKEKHHKGKKKNKEKSKKGHKRDKEKSVNKLEKSRNKLLEIYDAKNKALKKKSSAKSKVKKSKKSKHEKDDVPSTL